MGVIQTSKRIPRTLSPNKRVPDAQAIANTDAFSFDPPADQEYGNQGPNASLRAPDQYGEMDPIVNGHNTGRAAASGFAKEDTVNNNRMRTSKPKKANPHPGGGW